MFEDLAGFALDLVGQRLDDVGAGERVDGVDHPRLGRDDLLRPEGDVGRGPGRQRQGLVAAVAVQRLGAPEHRGHRLQRDPHDVVVRLLRRQRAAGGLGVKAHLLGAGLGGAEPVAHDPGPQPPGRPELGDLLQEVVVGREEERQPASERVDVETGGDGRFHVGDRMRAGEGDLLNRGRAGLADVIAADRDGVPVGQLGAAVLDDVGHDPQRRSRRKDVGAAGDVLLEDVVLHGAGDGPGLHPLPPRGGDVQRQQDDGGRIDRHRGRDPIQRNALEEEAHVLDGVDGHPDPAHLAPRERVVRVVADLGREVEGDAQPAAALIEQIAVAPVRLGGGAEAGVLAHRPQPPAVHRRMDAAGERKRAGQPQGVIGGPVRRVGPDGRLWWHRAILAACGNRPRGATGESCHGPPVETPTRSSRAGRARSSRAAARCPGCPAWSGPRRAACRRAAASPRRRPVR